MMEPRTADLEHLRRQLTDEERAIVNAIWAHYRDRNQWVPRRALQQEFGQAAGRASLTPLGGTILQEGEEDSEATYRLTFLGVLLTDQGPESEELLVRYLGYVRDRVRVDPRVEWVTSQEVEAALGLTADRSRLLRQLIRLSHWWGGGSGFGNQEWTVGVPVDVDDLLSQPDLRDHVREHVLSHFLPEAVRGAPGRLRPWLRASRQEGPRTAFWFVRDAALGQQLSLDWHEAQDVYQVRGWKSCVSLCGGILEGVLLDGLGRRKAPGGRPAARPAQPVSAAARPRTLPGLVAAAAKRGLLDPAGLRLGRALREFQTLIHPERQARQAIEVTKDEADAALEAVRSCLRQLAARASRKTGRA